MDLVKIDNQHYHKPISYFSEAQVSNIIHDMEEDPGEFFQVLINEFAVEYDSNVMTEKMITKLIECQKLAEKLVL